MAATADPELAIKLAQSTAALYEQTVNDLLGQVARRLGRGIDEPGWAEAKLAEQTVLRDEARRTVDTLLERLPGVVGGSLTEARGAGAAAGLQELGINRTLAPATNKSAVRNLVQETVTGLSNGHGQILRAIDDVYQRAVSDTSVPGVVSGTISTRQAVQRTLDKFATEGIRGYRDRSGRQWEIESYAEMSVRTASGRAHVSGTLDIFAENDRDLVIISDHAGECSVCRRWEGEILSITGRTPGYQTMRLARASGLFHANCRHSAGLYVPGLTKPMPKQTADPVGDMARQKQRYLERGVREYKRREVVALDDRAREEARAKRLQWQERLNGHIDEYSLKPKPGRTKVRLGFQAPESGAIQPRVIAPRAPEVSKTTAKSTEERLERIRAAKIKKWAIPANAAKRDPYTLGQTVLGKTAQEGDTALLKYVNWDYPKVPERYIPSMAVQRRGGRDVMVELPAGVKNVQEAKQFIDSDERIAMLDAWHVRLKPPGQKLVKQVSFMRGGNPDDPHWRKRYNDPDFTAAATANGSAGAIQFWNGRSNTNTMWHEWGHIADAQAGPTGGSPAYYEAGSWRQSHLTESWKEAGRLDREGLKKLNRRFKDLELNHGGGHPIFTDADHSKNKMPFNYVWENGITSYGRADAKEDFAESVRLYASGNVGSYRKPDGFFTLLTFKDVWPERYAVLNKLLRRYID